MKAIIKLQNKLREHRHICVGLDTDMDKLPTHLLSLQNPILEFNKAIIDYTKHAAAAFKLNLAFYERYGIQGIKTLVETINYIPEDILIIGDAKRGDIGNTSRMYAKSIFDELKFDAVTLNPYMGLDSIKPFIEYKDKLHFVLALTSNKSSTDFEKLKLASGKFLYQAIIDKVNEWNEFGNCGIVFGATNSGELKENINNFKNLFILLPGIGTQGGSLKDVCAAFREACNSNFILNISRALIYADSTENYASASSEMLDQYNKTIRDLFF